MKTIIEKEITGIMRIDNATSCYLVDLDGKTLENIVGGATGLNNGKHMTFPARVTIVVEDLRGTRDLGDCRRVARRLADLVKEGVGDDERTAAGL